MSPSGRWILDGFVEWEYDMDLQNWLFPKSIGLGVYKRISFRAIELIDNLH